MSAYSEIQTEFKDGDLLIEALTAMGFKPRNCIGSPEQLEGYRGDQRQQRADIIIPRSQVGNVSNDIGFSKGEDGKFRAVISKYDSHKYHDKWLNTVKVKVADAGIQRTARRMGMRTVSRKEVNGKIEYQFIKL